MKDIIYRCNECKKEISPDTGIIAVDSTKINSGSLANSICININEFYQDSDHHFCGSTCFVKFSKKYVEDVITHIKSFKEEISR